MAYWYSKGAALLFVKECVFLGNHTPCIRKFCILRAKYVQFLFQALFHLNLQKYMISGGRGRKVAALKKKKKKKRMRISGNHKCII